MFKWHIRGEIWIFMPLHITDLEMQLQGEKYEKHIF